MNSLKEISTALKSMDNILVISHASPDGDTLGSATALIRALRSIGKKANFACGDTIPPKFSYLFEDLTNEDFDVENYVSVDVASSQLFGTLKDLKMDMVIDHHNTTSIEAKYVYSDSTAAATTLVIFELLKEMNIEVCEKIATSLFTGLSTDTGCFKFSNCNARVHIVAAELIELGAKSTFINRLMFDTKTKASLKAEQFVFSNMEFYLDDKVVVATVPKDLLEETGAIESDLDAIPSMVRGIEGVIIGITLKEKDDGKWKASVRAIAPYNAAEICSQLGGGGHVGAAGCLLWADLEKSKNELLRLCKEHLESRI